MILISSTVKAQWTDSGSNLTTTDNVGIGTTTPATPLELNSSVQDKGLQIGAIGKTTKVRLFVAGGDYGYLNLGGTTILRGNGLNSHFDGRVGIGLTNPSSPLEIFSSDADKGLIIGTNGKNTKISMFVASGDYGYLNLGGTTIFRGNGLNSHLDGKLGIGTTSFGSHKLAVEGSIGAREIKVEATGWSDFVFEKDYELRTLEQVEEHINENGHLPEIPSEAEVTENGVNLGEMNAKLLQKIEELTLYLIEQNKQLDKANQNIAELQEKVNRLENK